MDIVESFIDQFAREYDYYEQTARLAAQRLESALKREGVQCIVTSRAKGAQALEGKLRDRHVKTPYQTVNDIYRDIVDLAGVRVALYFPSERDQVDRVISNLFFQYDKKRVFPRENRESNGRTNRFTGYSAIHYRVRLPASTLSEAEARFASANIEVQVASVLMHAWSEVEHDLVYKPRAGGLSQAEYSLLDQLNGLVLAGEIGLEELQRAGQARVAQAGRRFANHYELAAYLLGQTSAISNRPISDEGVGRVDLLFHFLATLELATPDDLKPYLELLHGDLERRPLADQIVDALIAENPDRFETYMRIRQATERTAHDEVGSFFKQWIRLEQLVRQALPSDSPRRAVIPTVQALERLGILDEELRFDVRNLSRTRNLLVHGIEIPAPDELRDAATRLSYLIDEIERRLPPATDV